MKTTIKERPILFSAPMVRAILNGSKTQTRRICKVNKQGDADRVAYAIMQDLLAEGVRGARSEEDMFWREHPCPYGQPGDGLWVRETWGHDPKLGTGSTKIPKGRDAVEEVFYRATDGWNGPWFPSIHMPRWASRIDLVITGVRVERLQDISEADVEAEGVDFMRRIPDADETLTGRQLYKILWEYINGPDSWGSNPWVWVIEFKKL